MTSSRPRLVSVLAPGLTAVLVLGGCGTEDTDTRSETAGVPLLREHAEDNDWALDADGSTPVIEGSEGTVTLELRDDAASGQGPCNVYRATLSIDGDALVITDVGTTMRACEPPAMAAEDDYITALQAVTTGDVDGDRLVLTGPDHIRLVFDEHDPDDDAASRNLTRTRENHR
jgi:heat shock protein HslJ